MIVVKYGSVISREIAYDCSGYPADWYEKCGSILLSTAIMKESLRWLGHVLRMKDDRLPKIVPFRPTV